MKRSGRVVAYAGLLTLAAAVLLLPAQPARAGTFDGVIEGEEPPFNLTASAGHISTPDGGSIYTWGYGVGAMQYPGPTLIVDQSTSPVTVNLTNDLNVPVSIVFPGQASTASGGVPGLLTREALPEGGTVSYTFTPANPGTYMYYSGTEQDLQIEMGLVGTIIVRPPGYVAPTEETPQPTNDAYGRTVDAADDFEREVLFFFSEMDPRVHELVEQGQTEWVNTSDVYDPLYWFINGRAFPDTLEVENVSWLPHQPYNCLPVFEAGERVLMRYVGAGQQIHPQHPHGNHARQIARDGRLLLNPAGEIAGPTVATPSVTPGQTMDFIFSWTGKGLGWDAYGDPTDPEFAHLCSPGPDGHDPVTYEWCPDHGKPIPVTLPNQQNLSFGGLWSGSPFLGHLGTLPPGEGGLNPWGGFTFPWHSHTEKELLNNDIFPGGMLTFAIVVPQGALD
jgi:FtsP/CotA-like multicopper oxidase with cupredoxin domain